MASSFSKATPDIIPHSDVVALSKECSRELFYVFRAAEERARVANNLGLMDLYGLLAQAFSMYIRPDNASNPFGCMRSGPTGRTAVTTDFTEQNILVFEALIKEPIGAAAKARIADIIWLRKKDRQAAEAAIGAYLDQAEAELEPEKDRWVFGREALRRAAQLWRLLGSPATLKTRLFSIAFAAARMTDPEPNDFYRVQIVELVSEFNLTDDLRYWLGTCEALAKSVKSTGDYEKVRGYLSSGLLFAKRLKDTEAERILNDSLTMSYVEEARKFKSEGAGALLIAGRYSKAIEACRRAGGMRQLIEELHAESLEIQKKALSEMKEVGVSQDITELINAGRVAVGDLPSDQVLRNIAQMAAPPKVERLRKNTIATSEKYALC